MSSTVCIAQFVTNGGGCSARQNVRSSIEVSSPRKRVILMRELWPHMAEEAPFLIRYQAAETERQASASHDVMQHMFQCSDCDSEHTLE
jgi:hypothetical protein